MLLVEKDVNSMVNNLGVSQNKAEIISISTGTNVTVVQKNISKIHTSGTSFIYLFI